MRKAVQLRSFARTLGAPLRDFQVILEDDEAMELLDALAAGVLGEVSNMEALRDDAAQCRARKDPWPVLEEFMLQGFELARARRVLQ